MGLLSHRLKLPFRLPSSLPPPPAPPPEFLCSISGDLMADPVILPSGETFERACIEACRDLSPSSSSSSSSSSSLLLIPNSALRSAIFRWCDIAGVPRPVPISSEAAARLARRFTPFSSPNSHTNCSTELPNENSSPSSSSSSNSNSKSHTICSTEFPNENTSPITSSSSSSSNSMLHTNCSTEFPNENPFPISDRSSSEIISAKTPEIPLEENLMAKLNHARIQDLDKTLTSILEASRESPARRVALCGSSRLLSALRSYLPTKPTALAIVVNLSLEPENKVRIVRSGAVPAIVAALQSPSRDHAAAALFSLAMDEQNRTPIGVLGAVPPLLRLFCNPKLEIRTRLDSGMALNHLIFAEMNMVKLVRITGAVKSLMNVAMGDEIGLRRVAMRLMVGMAGNKEGKSVMLDGGAVDAAVEFLKKEDEDRGMAVAMLYGMSMAGLRFRAMARRAMAEEVLQRVAESLEGAMKEMAMVTVRVIRGDERERERDMARILLEEEDLVVAEQRSGSSEKMVDRRRLNRDHGGGSGASSAGF